MEHMLLHIIDGTQIQDLSFQPGQTILSVLQEHGITSIHAPCGGKGLCRKCMVTIHNGLESYSCMACTTQAEDGMRVELNYKKRIHFAQDHFCQTYPADPDQIGYAIACDVGIQKIVCNLMNLQTGECVGTEVTSNIQRIFGSESLEQIQALSAEELLPLRIGLQAQLNQMIDTLCEKANIAPDRIFSMTVVGSPAAFRILVGDLSSPEKRPLPSMKFDNHEYHVNGDVFFAPPISDKIGSDISACILAGNLAEETKPVLLIDIGSTCQMILGCAGRYIACAASVVQALRGGNYVYGMRASRGAIAGVTYQNGNLKLDILGRSMPTGICGSGMLDALTIMLRLGIMDETGRISRPEELPPETAPLVTMVNGEPAFKLTKFSKIYVTQADVENFRRAKAVQYASIRVLAAEYGIRVEDIAKCQLSGGLGSFVSLESSFALELAPWELTESTQRLGNAAAGGSQSAVLSARARKMLMEIPAQVRCIHPEEHPAYQAAYEEGLYFRKTV